MSDYDLSQFGVEEIAALRNRPPVKLKIDALALFMILGNLQLALRHPNNTGPSAKFAKRFIDDARAQLAGPGSAIDTILRMGDDPAYDVSDGKPIVVTEVHNVYTVYELEPDGTQSAEPMLTFSRPQDWGHPRWRYHYCRIDFDADSHFAAKGQRYIHHCHAWQEVKRSTIEAMQMIAEHLWLVYQPGVRPELCDRSHLQEDDFWSDEWGPAPPHFEEPDNEYFGPEGP